MGCYPSVQIEVSLLILSSAVFIANGERYVAPDISSTTVTDANEISASIHIRTVVECALKCQRENCTSFSYGNTSDTGVEECFPIASHEYNGRQSRTVSGEVCQRWDAQTPHQHTFTDVDNNILPFPDATIEDAANYCRDPDGALTPWCYTMNPYSRWEYCPVEMCSYECFQTSAHEYNGRQSRTVSGEVCQRWDAQTPHQHPYMNVDYTLLPFPHATIEDAANYCRDPDGALKPWCYTMNPDSRWEYCPVEKCNYVFQHERCYSDSLTAKDYDGPWNRTRTGKVCQRWDEQTPHTHSYTSGFPDNTLYDAKNYCRDPDDRGYTWCFTMEPGTKWEACDVVSCTKYRNDNMCYNTESLSQYTGQWDMTVTDIKCQRWDSQTPHSHNLADASYFPDDTMEDVANYCRDPRGDGFLWCFTMDPGLQWQFCSINKCADDKITCYNGPRTRSYMGTRSKTETGRVCQRWDSQEPHSHSLTAGMFEEDTLADAENFCRDPTDSGELWCYTTDPGTPTESCGIGKCFGEITCKLYKDETMYQGNRKLYTRAP